MSRNRNRVKSLLAMLAYPITVPVPVQTDVFLSQFLGNVPGKATEVFGPLTLDRS